MICPLGTQGGNRTHTLLPELDFESSASTNSATKAFSVQAGRLDLGCKYKLFTQIRNQFSADLAEKITVCSAAKNLP